MSNSPKVFECDRGESFRYTGTLRDEIGNAVGSSIIEALTLTLSDKATGTIINSRNQQNVLNVNSVTLDASGNLVWTGTPADAAVVNTAAKNPRLSALFIFTWNAGAKTGKHEFEIAVHNI